METVNRYLNFEEIKPGLLRELVENIVIHAPDKSTGKITQKVEINYNFGLGNLSDITDEVD